MLSWTAFITRFANLSFFKVTTILMLPHAASIVKMASVGRPVLASSSAMAAFFTAVRSAASQSAYRYSSTSVGFSVVVVVEVADVVDVAEVVVIVVEVSVIVVVVDVADVVLVVTVVEETEVEVWEVVVRVVDETVVVEVVVEMVTVVVVRVVVVGVVEGVVVPVVVLVVVVVGVVVWVLVLEVVALVVGVLVSQWWLPATMAAASDLHWTPASASTTSSTLSAFDAIAPSPTRSTVPNPTPYRCTNGLWYTASELSSASNKLSASPSEFSALPSVMTTMCRSCCL